MVNVAAFYEGEADRAASATWVDELRRRAPPGRRRGAYVNFLGDEGEARIHAAYPGATWIGCRDQGRYDPDNLFRLNQNIAPAAT